MCHMSEPPTHDIHQTDASTDATLDGVSSVSVPEADVVFSIATPSQTGEPLNMPASPVDTGTALKDPTTPLRQALERTTSERDKLVAERDRFSKASAEYKAADAKVKEAETRVADADSDLRIERKRLDAYLEVHRSFDAGVKVRSVTQILRAHDTALKLFSERQKAEDWETAGLAIGLVIQTVTEMTKIEKEDAATLATARSTQLERANALKKEVVDSQLAAKRAAQELAELKAKMAEAAERISTIEAKEEKEISEAERAYVEANKESEAKRSAMSTTTPMAPTPTPTPTPTPSPAVPSAPEQRDATIIDKGPEPTVPQAPRAPQAPQAPQANRSFFTRQPDPPPKPTPLPSLTRPYIPSEVDRVWEMLLDAANFPRTNRPRDLRISRADFARAVAANPELQRVFGKPRTARRTISRIDRDGDDDVSKDELSDFLRFPSARRRNVTAATGDAVDAFESIMLGVERARDFR